ncbi:MAG: hypothetical protein ACFCVK_23730 [Acidimicrobiales bacterium]
MAGTKVSDVAVAVVVQDEWTVDDERQLSYTSVICLAECVRELHWNRDVEPLVSTALDSTIRNLGSVFSRPMFIGDLIVLSYRITAVGTTSYRMTVELSTGSDRCAAIDLTSVFVHPERRSRTAPPPEVRARLDAARRAAEPKSPH